MTPEAKLERLCYLKSIAYPSDQEIKEMQDLLKELFNVEPKPKKQKRSLLEIIREKIKEKPITLEEIQELKKKAIKYKYIESIEISKAKIRKAKSNKISSSSRQRQRTYDTEKEMAGLLDRATGKVNDKDFRKVFFG